LLQRRSVVPDDVERLVTQNSKTKQKSSMLKRKWRLLNVTLWNANFFTGRVCERPSCKLCFKHTVSWNGDISKSYISIIETLNLTDYKLGKILRLITNIHTFQAGSIDLSPRRTRFYTGPVFVGFMAGNLSYERFCFSESAFSSLHHYVNVTCPHFTRLLPTLYNLSNWQRCYVKQFFLSVPHPSQNTSFRWSPVCIIW
jgi:hypothetical protein